MVDPGKGMNMKKSVFKKSILKYVFSFLIFSIFTSSNVFAKRVVKIFDARRSFALNKGQKTYKDYYINGGSEFGLKAGMLVHVKRRVTLYDSFQNKSPGDLMVKVGVIKVIHVNGGVSVAREYSLATRSNRPVLDYNYIMIGDSLDLNTVKMDRGSAQAPSRKDIPSREPVEEPKKASAKIQKAKLRSVSFSSEAKTKPLNMSVN